jgi:hypothetical protein
MWKYMMRKGNEVNVTEEREQVKETKKAETYATKLLSPCLQPI